MVVMLFGHLMYSFFVSCDVYTFKVVFNFGLFCILCSICKFVWMLVQLFPVLRIQAHSCEKNKQVLLIKTVC